MRAFVRVVVSVALVAVSACGDDPPPVAPTPTPAPAPALVRLEVDRPTPLWALGQQVQLHAFAIFDDGSRREVTADSRWTAFNDQVVRVTPAGLVTAIGFGSVDVLASYRDQSGGRRVTVDRALGPHFRLTGVVRDADDGKPLSGAVVARLGSGGTATAVSDGNGLFDLGDTAGVLTVRANRFGYAERFLVLDLAAPETIEVPLIAEPRAFVERQLVDRFEGDGGIRVRFYPISTRAPGLLDALVEALDCPSGTFIQVEVGWGPASNSGRGSCSARAKIVVGDPACWLRVTSDGRGPFRLTWREPR